MASLRSRTLQLLLIAYGFSFVFASGVRFFQGTSTLFAATGLLAAGAISYACLRGDGLTLTLLGGSRLHLGRAAVTAAAIAVSWTLLGMAFQGAGLLGDFLLLLPGDGAGAAYLLLEGTTEELLFRGLLVTGLARLLDRGRFPWYAWLISGLLSALYHLPGALWTGVPAAVLLQRTGLSLATALLLFGPLYLLSRNLWLVVFAHAMAAGLVVPHLPEHPLAALAFIAVALLLGRFLLRSGQPLPLSYRAGAARVAPAAAGAGSDRTWHVI